MPSLFERRDPSRPDWSRDQLESPLPPVAEAPYFDKALNAWVFSRYADILTAFRTPELAPASLSGDSSAELQAKKHQQMRLETQQALSPARLGEWRQWLTRYSCKAVEALSPDTPIDLLADYGRPLCLAFAATVTGIRTDEAEKLCEKARAVSAAAAEPYDEILRAAAKPANAALKDYFQVGPEGLRDSGFVALSQTMPSLLGNTWFALIRHPLQWTLLHQNPDLVEQAIEELLRYAGLVRILKRKATADVLISGVQIRKDDSIIFRIIAANRDPERFSNPNEVNLTRTNGAHLTFGASTHACVGASLIRLTAVAVTAPLLAKFAGSQSRAASRMAGRLWLPLPQIPLRLPSRITAAATC